MTISTTSRVVLLLARPGDNFLVKRFLEKRGIKIYEELPAKKEKVDAILIDIRTGKPKLEEALAYKKRASLFIPLIVLVPEKTNTNKLYKEGVDDCWHYPIYQEEFFRRLEFFLSFRKKMIELKAKKESQRLEALGFLAIGVAHDFNNLLTPILGYADICLIKTEDKEQRVYLERIKEIVLKSRELIEQIFLFCNPEKDTEQKIDLVKEIKSLFPLFRAAVPQGIILTLEVYSEPLWVKIQASKFHRLLLNLITNAVKAIEKERGRIEIKLKKENKNALLLVQDSGRGFDENTKKKIFELFYSSSNTSGIGLNIIKNIVEEANGKIFVESQTNIGTIFKIYFPLSEKDSESNITYLFQKPSCISGKILVVDDEITILELFKQFLEALEFEVLTACSGEEALKIFIRHRDEIVLLISDYFLPDLKGDELIIRIKKEVPDLPVIFCTGLQKEIIFPNYPNIKTLTKPFSFKELQQLIYYLLESKEKISA